MGVAIKRAGNRGRMRLSCHAPPQKGNRYLAIPPLFQAHGGISITVMRATGG
jgi:hypothetical protein